MTANRSPAKRVPTASQNGTPSAGKLAELPQTPISSVG